jgi:hypothetical protein
MHLILSRSSLRFEPELFSLQCVPKKGLCRYLKRALEWRRARMEMIEKLDRMEKNRIFGKEVKMILAISLCNGRVNNTNSRQVRCPR